MHTFAPVALTVGAFASIFGALVMCVLDWRDGLLSSLDHGPAARRLLVTRVGHAVAGTCFAATGVLVIVALLLPAPNQPTMSVAPTIVNAALSRTTDGVQVTPAEEALARRVAELELRLARLAEERRSGERHARRVEKASPSRRTPIAITRSVESVNEHRGSDSPRLGSVSADADTGRRTFSRRFRDFASNVSASLAHWKDPVHDNLWPDRFRADTAPGLRDSGL